MIIRITFALLPVISALTWGIVMWLASYDSLTQQENRLKKLLVMFFFTSALGWFSVFAYTWFPSWFVRLNAFAYLAFLLAPIQFYRFIRVLSGVQTARFSLLHYALPILICGVLFFWSFFVPYEIRLALVQGRGAIYPGYETYSYLFLSKPAGRIIFNIIYTFLSLQCLYRYYLSFRQSSEHSGQSLYRWIILLMGFTFSLMLAATAIAFLPRGEYYESLFTLLSVVFLISQHILLVYNIIRRNFLHYTFTANRNEIIVTDSQTIRQKYARYDNQTLNRKQFEKWIRTHKPYLNPQLKLTDMAQELEIGRTYLSTFINRNYGMNFNAYINRCRLNELERIRRLPSNARREITQLVTRAGFGSYRNYIRYKNSISENNKNEQPDEHGR